MHPSYPPQLREAIARYLPHKGLPLIAPTQRLRWTPRMIVVMAILMSFSSAGKLCGRFAEALEQLTAMYPSRRRPGHDCCGFMRRLARETSHLLALIKPELQRHVLRLAGACRRTSRWNCFAVDGSRVECPMTRANEAAFGTAGKAGTGPQQYLTMIYNIPTGIIWDYRRDHARGSERHHLRHMLPMLPDDCMLLMDAGFTGYGLLRRIMESGRHLIVRVGRNVRLLRKLGYHVTEVDGVVYLWPAHARRQKLPPVVLRHVFLKDANGQRVHLLTSVLDESFSDAEVARLYRRRWGIEVEYRSLKQTLERRRMVCDSPTNARVELDWSVIALWILRLMTVEEMVASGQPPTAMSVALALRAVRGQAVRRRGIRRRPTLIEQLRAAVKDAYKRKGPKMARHWPHKKREKPPGDPVARMATASEVLLAQELKNSSRAA